MIIQMGDVYALSPFGPITIVKSVQGGGGFSSGHRWGILGGRQGIDIDAKGNLVGMTIEHAKANADLWEFSLQEMPQQTA